MPPLAPDSPLEGRETMAALPEAINLVKPGRNGAGSPSKDNDHGSSPVEDNRELPMVAVKRSRDDVGVTEGSNQGSISHVAVPTMSANDQTSRQGMKRYIFREPTQLQLQADAGKIVSVGSKVQVPRRTTTGGGKRGTIESFRWMEISAGRPDVTGVEEATNTYRDANSDDEYIDVETFDPIEDQRQWLLEKSRRLVASKRAQYQDITSDPKTPSSSDQQDNSRGTSDTGGEYAVVDDDRVPSLDSGFYSDEEARVRMRSSSDWTDVVVETHRSKDSGAGRLSSLSKTQEDAEKSHRRNYQRVYLVNEDKRAFSPPESTTSSELPAPQHELRPIATLKHKGSTTAQPSIYPYVQSYGGYTLYVPGNVHPPEKDISTSSNSSVRVPDTVRVPISRNSTEVVYTMDTSTVRMSTRTSSVIDSQKLYDNTKSAAAVAQRKSVVVATGDDNNSGQDFDRRNGEDARVYSESVRTKSVERSKIDVSPTGRDEFSHRYLHQMSSYSPDRAVIIPIPNEKSAFINTPPSNTHGSGLKAMVAPARYILVEGGVPGTRNSGSRNTSNSERMAPPLGTVRRYVPSGTFLPRGYDSQPQRMVVKNPPISKSDFVAVREGATSANSFNGSNVRYRSDARMTPDHSQETEYMYHQSKPMRIVYTPISDIAEDEPPRKVSRLTCGRERLLSIAEIEHESQTVARHTRYPTMEAVIVGAQSRDDEGRPTSRWPHTYGSHILKTYLRGQDVVDHEPLHRSNSPLSRGEVPDLDSDVRHIRFRDRLYVEEEGSPVDRRNGNITSQIQSVAHGHRDNRGKRFNDQNSNGDANATLDLSKKDPVQRRDGAAFTKEVVHFTQEPPRYVSAEEGYSPTELRAKSVGYQVVTPASVIVANGVGGGRRDAGGEHVRQVVRTVIVSGDRRNVSNGQKLTHQPEGGSERLREVRSVGRDGAPTTVLAPEPGGQRSRYMITREGDGNKFIIREVESDVRPAVAQLIAIRDRIEGERSFPGYQIGGVQGWRIPKDVSGDKIRDVHHSKGAADDRRHPPASVIRTAPPAPPQDGQLECPRLVKGDLPDEEVVEVYRVRRVLPSGMPHFEPTVSECAWADAEWASCGGKVDEDSVYGPSDSDEDRALRLRVSVILWALLGGGRLRAVGWPGLAPRRVLWRTVDVCCSVAGAKSPAAVPLPADHDCGADMACYRDHAHRFLEVCAPTRDHWKRYGWASLTIDAVVAKVYREDIAPWLRTLPDEVVPAVVRSSVRQLQAMRRADSPPLAAPATPLATPPHDATPATSAGAAAPSQLQGRPPAAPGLSQDAAAATAPEESQDARKKRGRPAKPPSKADAGRVERVMLWRFLLNLLEDPRNEPCIHWVNRDQGIFRILNTDWLARLWGRRHGNPRMTYEKMARAMRTYYRSKVLQPVPRSPNLPRKLVYKFNPAVVQRVAAANKLAQQQQQQQHQQRFRQPRQILQYEVDHVRHPGADPQPQSPPPLQVEGRGQQGSLVGHQQRRLLPQHEHYYLSEKRQHKPQLQPADDRHKPLEDGQRWEPNHQELQPTQGLHQSDHHRLSPEESHESQALLHHRMHQYHQSRLQLYQVRPPDDEQKSGSEVHNTVHKEANQHSQHHHQQRQHQNTDEQIPRSHSGIQHHQNQQQDYRQHQNTFERNNHHQPINSPSDHRQHHSPSLHMMQRVSQSPNDPLNPITKDSHQQHVEEPQLQQAPHQHDLPRSTAESHNQHDVQQQQVPNEGDSSTPRFQQT